MFASTGRYGHLALRPHDAYVEPVDADEANLKQVTASCEECGVKMAPDSSRLRLEITCDDELLMP